MAAPSVCFVSTEIFPGTPGGIGRLIQQSALALEHAGWPSVLLLDVPEAATEKFRVYARSMLPRTSCVTVAELLTGLATDDDIPLWAFHFPEYWRSYRVALALRRLLADTRLAGIEFPDYCGLGYVAQALRARGHEVRLADMRMARAWPGRPEPDIVGISISVMNTSGSWASTASRASRPLRARDTTEMSPSISSRAASAPSTMP